MQLVQAGAGSLACGLLGHLRGACGAASLGPCDRSYTHQAMINGHKAIGRAQTSDLPPVSYVPLPPEEHVLRTSHE